VVSERRSCGDDDENEKESSWDCSSMKRLRLTL